MFLTGRGETEEFFRDLHVDGFLTKPFHLSGLFTEVKSILSRHYEACLEQERNIAAPEPVQRHILIVEKDAKILEELTEAFLDAGYLVNQAGTVEKAEEKARKDRPGLLLMRVDLPDISGESFEHDLSRLEALKGVLLVLYAPTEEHYEKDSTQAVCQKLNLRSPVNSTDPRELLKVCDRVLQESKPR